MDDFALFRGGPEPVQTEWVDYNGHLNHAYYIVIFDHGIDVVLDHLGVGAGYRSDTGSAMYMIESHCCYRRELREGDIVAVETQLVDADSKRLHLYQRMLAEENGCEAATFEALLTHVDGAAGKATEMPESAQARASEVVQAHRGLSVPDRLGRVIGIRR